MSFCEYKALFRKRNIYRSVCRQVRGITRTRPSCRKDENVSCQLDTGEMLLRFPRMFQTHPVHSDDWVTYSGLVGKIALAESFAYSGRSITNADIVTRSSLFFRRFGVQGSKRESNGNSIIIIAAGTNGTATLLLAAPPRKPSKAAGVKTAPVASINFVIRRCAVLRLAKVYPRSQMNARIYQPVSSLCGR